jgi:hypothetical protein
MTNLHCNGFRREADVASIRADLMIPTNDSYELLAGNTCTGSPIGTTFGNHEPERSRARPTDAACRRREAEAPRAAAGGMPLRSI